MVLAARILVLVDCLVVLMLLSRISSTILGRTVGGGLPYLLLLAPGTVLHEGFHALACIMTMTRIYVFKPFRPQRKPDGSIRLGEVVHREVGPLRTFFIGVAPLIGGAFVIYLLAALILPEHDDWMALLVNGRTYLFLVLAFLVALGLSPSRQDLRALPAFLMLVVTSGVASLLMANLIFSRTEISAAADTASTALKTAGNALVFVVIIVTIVVVLQRALLYLHRGQ